MSLRTIKYLVVDNVVEDVPDAAPEIDVEVSTLDDIAAALLRTTRLPASADIYLQTQRPDGSLRWQPLTGLSSLPDGLLLAKLVKPKGGVTGGPRPAAHSAPQQYPQQQQQQQQQQQHSLIGKLLKKVVGGGGSGHTPHTTNYGSRPMGAGGMMMGGAGAGAAAGGFSRLGGGATDDVDAQWEQQVAEEMALAQLEEDALMQRDEDGDGVPDALDDHDNRGDDTQVEQEAYETFEAAAGDYADQQDGDNEAAAFENDDGNVGGDDGGNFDNGAEDDAGGFDEGGDDFGGGDDE